jgi:rRNA-processing protein FCF1
MNNYYEYLFSTYRRKGILLDTNILLLYFVGTFNKEEITKFKRTKMFVPEDYDALLYILSYFEKVVTTPNILTEVSNLLGQLREDLKIGYFNYFAQAIGLLIEEYAISIDVASMVNFYKFGLTDMAIINITREKYLVLTEDFKLSQYLQHTGIDVLNFNHIRTGSWQS